MNEKAGRRRAFSRPLSRLKTLKRCLLEELFAIRVPSAEEDRFGILDNGVNKAFCRRVCLVVNS